MQASFVYDQKIGTFLSFKGHNVLQWTERYSLKLGHSLAYSSSLNLSSSRSQVILCAGKVSTVLDTAPRKLLYVQCLPISS